ncbi:N-lysine methyltransferase SMYD2 [Cladorrhinum sp. PSN259]|nr:N-lysine methyltransferase SMYD2 [Cladorrhinum sp. PSN259]
MFSSFVSTSSFGFWIITLYATQAAQAAGGGGARPSSSLTTKKAKSDDDKCIYNPPGPLVPHKHHKKQCSLLVDDETTILRGVNWEPWDFAPTCFLSKPPKNPNGKIKASSSRKKKKMCVYTTRQTWTGGALSVVTTPAVASHLASYLFDNPAVPWLENDRGGIPFSLPKTSPPPYEVEEIPNKGKGVVAKRVIKEGELLMAEMPLIMSMLDGYEDYEAKDFLKLLKRGAEQLGEREKGEMLGLARKGKEKGNGNGKGQAGGYSVVMDLINTNSFRVQVAGRGHSGVYPRVARINHACKPNCFTRYSPSTLMMEVVAYRDIQPGEELSISYAPLNMLTKDRRALLQAWGFNCTCSLCADPAASKRSDIQRARIQQILEELDRPEGRTPEKLIANIKEVEELAHKEGMTAQIGDLYGIIANIFLEIGEPEKAREYSRIAVRNLRWYAGFDSERAEDAMAFRDKLDGKETKGGKGTEERRDAADSDLRVFAVE